MQFDRRAPRKDQRGGLVYLQAKQATDQRLSGLTNWLLGGRNTFRGCDARERPLFRSLIHISKQVDFLQVQYVDSLCSSLGYWLMFASRQHLMRKRIEGLVAKVPSS